MNSSKIIVSGLTFLILCAFAILLVRWHGYLRGDDDVLRATYTFLEHCERKDFEQAAASLDSEFSTMSADETELMDKSRFVSALMNQLDKVSSIESRNCSASFDAGGYARVSCYVEIRWESDSNTPLVHFGNYDFDLKKRGHGWKIRSIKLRR